MGSCQAPLMNPVGQPLPHTLGGHRVRRRPLPAQYSGVLGTKCAWDAGTCSSLWPPSQSPLCLQLWTRPLTHPAQPHQFTGAATELHPAHTRPPGAGLVWAVPHPTPSQPLLLVSKAQPPPWPCLQQLVCPFLVAGYHPSSALVPAWPRPGSKQPLTSPQAGHRVPESHPHVPQGPSRRAPPSRPIAATPPPLAPASKPSDCRDR